MLGPGYPGQNWPNPPTALVVMAPFGLLNYFPALIAWWAVSLLAFYLAGRREVADWRILVVAAVSPAALLCVLSGQSSLLTTAALLAIFAQLDKRPSSRGRADRAAHGQAAARHSLSLRADRFKPLACVCRGRPHRTGAARGQRRARRDRKLARLHRQGAAAAARSAAGCRRHRDAVSPDRLHEYPRARRQPRRRKSSSSLSRSRLSLRYGPRSAIAGMSTRAPCKRCSLPARCRPRPIWAPTICCP